jgi:hypothetical protein
MALPAYSNPGLLEKAVGAPLPSADVNKILGMINDAFGSGGPVWTAFTPTLTQNGAAVAVTVTFAEYLIIGKMAHVILRLVTTAAGAAGVIKVESIPAAIAPARVDDGNLMTVCGTGLIRRQGVAYYPGAAIPVSASTIGVMTKDGTNLVGASPSYAIASGDHIGLNLKYKIV